MPDLPSPEVVEAMDSCVAALALELPVAVWAEVRNRWTAALRVLGNGIVLIQAGAAWGALLARLAEQVAA